MNRKKLILVSLLALLTALVLVVGGYVLYVQLNYYRLPPVQDLTIENPVQAAFVPEKNYSILTWNIGFGAYDHDFSFFMDKGMMKNGQKVEGSQSRAHSLAAAEENTKGAKDYLQSLAVDMILLQEVDMPSTRSYGVNQREILQKALPQMESTWAENFHSAYLFYPLNQPIGQIHSGLLTLSAMGAASAERISYTVDDSFPAKFFDLDRCFSVMRFPVAEGKSLVVINNHMSAYDEGGKIRQKQLAELFTFIEEEYQAGNYVIVGGDFNHALGQATDFFPSQQEVPDWVFPFPAEEMPQGFSLVKAENSTQVPTCRSTDMIYRKGENYTVVIDGFLVSDNVLATSENIDLDFTHSDHNPVKLTFSLMP